MKKVPFARISDEELRAAVDRMTRVALTTVTSDHHCRRVVTILIDAGLKYLAGDLYADY